MVRNNLPETGEKLGKKSSGNPGMMFTGAGEKHGWAFGSGQCAENLPEQGMRSVISYIHGADQVWGCSDQDGNPGLWSHRAGIPEGAQVN